LEAVRGSSEALRKKPLAIFDACPSPPLKWSNLTTQSIIDCARAGIPSEFVAMPLAGATAPATLSGALVQHTAENLAGLVITQLAAPGAPVIFGGSPAIFDMRAATPPMGAVESMMLSIGYTQIGKTLRLPTHGYMGLSDAKCVDAQAGLESGIGTILAALAGVNVVSGGGMMDYENCQSLEKLVIDNEICGMAYRLINGITQRDERMALDLFIDLGDSTDFLTHPHTLQWFREEQFMPKIVNRENYQQWMAAGKPDLADLASKEAARILSTDPHFMLSEETVRELNAIMLAHGRPLGLTELPPLP
jgi:trimethylamine--corrinoid protein Co-methyltransferase